MSDSDLQEQFMKLDNLVDHQELNDELRSLDDLLGELQEEEEAAPVKTPEPRVHWRKRDIDGNIVYARPRSSRNQSNKADHIQKTDPPINAPDTNCEVTFAPETVECFLQVLQNSLSDISDDEASASRDPLPASSSWSTRQSLFSERWRAERPRLVNTAAAQGNVATRICQQCGSNPAAVRCCDCLLHVLYNRDAMTPGLYQPLPPTTFVVDKALSHCVRLVPVEIPDKMCGCSSESLRLSPGKTVAVITMNGRYDLSMPVLSWAAGVVDLNRSDYWPATLHFATIYATDVFFSFEEMKMAAPGLSVEEVFVEGSGQQPERPPKDLPARIEVLVASIKRRSYKDTDGNKGRARIRRKIREEKGILTSVVEKYNRMVPNTETILSESHSTIKT
ncbi:hypothetical protein G5714_001275 [Onychostoma macrolepis]|uniref:Uncharacterized protein n=1 Tax=Onychostoma macrolepis TaxID=369639 RepID=A0A7J6DKB9_9TELE|nr:hypothetical protein G5714_001275 [Onychostoma macrolepis]